ncbi:bZIP transcription factor 12-like isoform X2 [Phragmites australis]|uniref:bZIP transcription factor 12-like isoform X2 n=1 Tax=Phragmites australis TaxID=29695 RepID=UPI002D7A1D8C|nr:bZIP transcription factor 12-like isoform X2 [Phragmites australis]
MASSRVMASSSPSHTASDIARFAQAASKPGGGSGLGSMNVEELLRSIYGDMPTPAPASGGDRPMSPAPATEIASRRTAEEVWKEITGGGGSRGTVTPAAPAVVAAGGGGGGGGSEMTLEDFLATEGAVKEDEVRVSGPSEAAGGPVAMGFLSGAEGLGGRGGGGGKGRKRRLMDPVDRAAMQRQKRMIKNRESAARSRERKQAYIAELESLVAQLEEESAELLREQEERHQKRLKELMERVTPVIVRKNPSRYLRRTNSMQ